MGELQQYPGGATKTNLIKFLAKRATGEETADAETSDVETQAKKTSMPLTLGDIFGTAYDRETHGPVFMQFLSRTAGESVAESDRAGLSKRAQLVVGSLKTILQDRRENGPKDFKEQIPAWRASAEALRSADPLAAEAFKLESALRGEDSGVLASDAICAIGHAAITNPMEFRSSEVVVDMPGRMAATDEGAAGLSA